MERISEEQFEKFKALLPDAMRPIVNAYIDWIRDELIKVLDASVDPIINRAVRNERIRIAKKLYKNVIMFRRYTHQAKGDVKEACIYSLYILEEHTNELAMLALYGGDLWNS